ncbi:MAG: ParB/Srx family N-terminal domain-containing protein [Pseudomonadota bacterium]
MKRLSIVGLLLIFTLFGCFATGVKVAEVPTLVTRVEIAEVSVVDIQPTQPAAGYAASEVSASKLLKLKNIMDETTFRNQVLQEKPLRAVIGPGGGIYLTDGHHRALGVYRASTAICESSRPAAEVDACLRGVKVRVRIEGDYSKSTWNDFVDALLKENNIYLPQTIKARLASRELTKEQLFKGPDRVIPPSLGKLANDPMRSSMGTLFHYQGINGNLFANYLEFLVAERLGGEVKVQAGQEFDPRVQVRLLKALFSNEDLVKFIRCLARRDKESWNEAQKEVNQVVGLDSSTPFAPETCATGN